MNLTPIINALRKRCPTFERRFAGAAEWAGLTIEHAPAMPAAYVVPLREDASENESQNGYSQTITNTFGVIVLVSNTADVRGQGATATLDSLKPELFRALLSGHQEPKDEYSEIVYEGGSLLYMDDARLAYQLEFTSKPIAFANGGGHLAASRCRGTGSFFAISWRLTAHEKKADKVCSCLAIVLSSTSRPVHLEGIVRRRSIHASTSFDATE